MAVEFYNCYNPQSRGGRIAVEKCTVLYTPGPVGLVGVLGIVEIEGSDLSVKFNIS